MSASPVRGSDELDLFRVWARRIRESDSSALEAFFRAVHGPLVRYATRFVPEASAEDVVQDAFVRIWNGRERIDPSQSLKAFAYRTVRNLSLNRIRDGKTREALLAERYEPPVSATPDPDDDLARSDLADHLRDWIDALPARQREALELSRFEGLTHEQVAEAMGVSPRTVNNHLVKALRTIRDRVRAYEPSLLDS
ncbi:MAG: RNA polymerase sigma-70 factor [Gemmatimonadota bacterium]